MPAENPVFSPDGSQLAFRVESKLCVRDLAAGVTRIVDHQIDDLMPSSRSYSPDGRWLALIGDAGLTLMQAHGDNNAGIKAFPAPSGYNPTDLLWTGDSHRLLVLAKQKSGKQRKLLRFDPAAGRMLSEHQVDGVRLLGWRAQDGSLLLSRSGAEGDEAGRLGEADEFISLRPPGEASAEYYVEYIPATDQILFSPGADDASDHTVLYLAPLGHGEESRWLEPFRRISSIRFTRGGGWAVFCDQTRRELIDAPGGDLYLVQTGGEPRLVRRADGSRFYTSPFPRP